jgi:hypothetical protein
MSYFQRISVLGPNYPMNSQTILLVLWYVVVRRFGIREIASERQKVEST